MNDSKVLIFSSIAEQLLVGAGFQSCQDIPELTLKRPISFKAFVIPA
jgi:hypothetical protein